MFTKTNIFYFFLPFRLGETGKAKRKRTHYTNSQMIGLEREFECYPFISNEKRRKLSPELGVAESKIKVWFQNRRLKHNTDRKKKSLPPLFTVESSPLWIAERAEREPMGNWEQVGGTSTLPR